MLNLYFFFLGAIFGSFVNALVWRVHNRLEHGSKKLSKKRPISIVKGRSVCESCGHELQAIDLLPVISWLSLGGRCRYCRDKISWQNPVVEVVTAAMFGLSYLFWPMEFDTFGWLAFGVWLAMIVALMTLLVYDVRWSLLPNRLMYPLIIASIVMVVVEAIFFDGGPEVVKEAVIGLGAIGGFFYALFMVSNGRWIGGGDVKLAMFIGIFLGFARGVVALYIGFISASLLLAPLLLMKKVGRKQKVPFGPFLIVGIFIAQIWGADIVDWYSDTFLYGFY